MMAMYSLEARHRRFTLAFAFGCFVVQCIRLPYGRLALWSRRDTSYEETTAPSRRAVAISGVRLPCASFNLRRDQQPAA